MKQRIQHLPKFRQSGVEKYTEKIWPWPETPKSIHQQSDPRAISTDWLSSKNFNDGSGARVNNVLNFNWKSKNAFDLDALKEFKGHIGRVDQSDFTVAAVFKAPEDMDYCPGADLVKLYHSGVDYNLEFYKTQQETMYYMATMRTPGFACIQGNTFGLGAGLTAHTNFRILTESGIWAMPNTLYGAFPDCGMSYRLPRLDGDVGMFLALTGKRVETLDIARVGLVSHFMETQDLNRFCQETGRIEGNSEEATETFYIMLNRWIKQFPDDKDPSAILPYIPAINRCFNQRSLEDIFEQLKEENTFWSKNVLERMKTQCSPLMLHVTFKLQRLGRYMYSLAEVLELEFRVHQHMLKSHDYWEGIKAHMIEKRPPVWQHKSIYDVRPEEIAAFFEPAEHKLDLMGCEVGNQPHTDPFDTYPFHVLAALDDPFNNHILDRQLTRMMPDRVRTAEVLVNFYRELFRQGDMADVGGRYYHKLHEYMQTTPDDLTVEDITSLNKDFLLADLKYQDVVENDTKTNKVDPEEMLNGVNMPFHQKDRM